MDIFSNIKNDMQKVQNYDNLNQNNDNNIKKSNDINVQNKELKDQDEKVHKEELKKKLQKIVEDLNKSLNPLNDSLKFKFDDKVDILTVKVVDTKSDKVVREFPPKEALRLMEKMREVVGMLFDEKG